jgi:hypothetical protein
MSIRYALSLVMAAGITISAASPVFAGSLTPSAPPGTATNYTLSDIFTRLSTDAAAGAHAYAPTTTPQSTFPTLSDIYNAIPTVDAANIRSGVSILGIVGSLLQALGNAGAGDVFSGVTFSSSTASNQTGTLALACATSTFDGVSNRVPDAYDGAGNGTNRWCMTDSATAGASDILTGKKAWVNGAEVNGSVPAGANVTGANGLLSFIIPNGLYSGSKTAAAADSNLVAGNILNTASIFGVTGSYNIANLTIGNVKSGATFGTSSTGTLLQALGNAGVGDVLSGKTFSSSTAANVSGTIPVKTGDNAVVTSATSTNKLLLTPLVGYYDGTATVSTTSAAFTAANIAGGVNLFGILGTMSAGYSYGDSSAEKVLTTATGAGTYNAANLITSNVKSGITFGTSSTGTYTAAAASGYPGSGWVANGSGDGSTALNKANCDAQAASSWAWFSDMNNNGVTTDPEDGVCVQTTVGGSLPSASWNGAVLMGAAHASTTATSVGTSNTFTSTTTSWAVANAYVNSIASWGGSNACWGVVQSNSTSTVTVYGQWLGNATATGYPACSSVPQANDTLQIYNDGQYDNSWIGDYTCTGNFPSGTVVPHSYPTVTDTGALAKTDCYDGKRDLLPNIADRAMYNGTVTATGTDGLAVNDIITDGNIAAGAVYANVYIGQKILITSGTGSGSTGIITSNSSTTNSFTVTGWSSTAPDVGSAYSVIYIIPRSYTKGANDTLQNKGPLSPKVLNTWTGTRLPTFQDFYDYCGKSGSTNGQYVANSSDPLSSVKTYGNYGNQIGRTTQVINLANTNNEWLSGQNYYNNALGAGSYACSLVYNNSVYSGNRFRAVFRP